MNNSYSINKQNLNNKLQWPLAGETIPRINQEAEANSEPELTVSQK